MTELVSNVHLWSLLIAWFSAQFIKILIALFRREGFTLKMLMASGGMPSSHSASVCALAASIAVRQGMDSPIFAVACLFAFIVMYDAAGVRRETGEQAKLLNKISSDLSNGNTKYLERDLKELVGHTPLQVFAGAALGIILGVGLPHLFQLWGV